MTFPSEAHGRLGSHYFRFDENQIEFGNPPCRHWSRSLFSNITNVPGHPGARSINPEQLRIDWTEFVGEGQYVMKHDDEVLAHRYYKSEGLNMRIPGEFSLNRSTVVQSPLDSTGGAASTIQGDTFTDVVGTSTTVNTTDKRINVVNDEIQSTAHTPGAGQVQVEFYVYNEGTQYTTIEGSSLVLAGSGGSGRVSGSDFILDYAESVCRTTSITGLAAQPRTITLYASRSTAAGNVPLANFGVLDITNSNNLAWVTGENAIRVSSTTSAAVSTLTFTPQTGHTYRLYIGYEAARGSSARMVIDKITHGITPDPNNSVQVRVYNSTGAAVVTGTTKIVTVANTTTANIVNVSFTAAAATDYKYRVLYSVGNQRPVVDKVVATVQSTASWVLDDIELGMGGKVWLIGHRAAVDSNAWTYNFSTDAWTEEQAITGATAATCRALAHTDKWQYGLFSDGKVYQFDDGTTDNDYTAAITGAVGMAICQNRMFVLSEDSTNGVDITVFAVDADVSAAATASLTSAEVTSALNTADTTLRQRMVGTSTGARFFVNYSDVTSVVYEADISTGTLVITEIARLDIGARATCISFVGGITFIGGQMFAETGEVAIPTMWALDQQDQVVRVGDFAPDDPDSRPPMKMQPYDTSLWIQQGTYIWRYSLRTGGLFREYQLDPTTPANQCGIAVVRAHQFALYSDEGAHVTGSVGTYRSAGTTASNRWVSSITNFGLPGTTKQLDHLEITTDTLPASTSVSLEYQIDQSGTWVPVASFTSGTKHRRNLLTETDTVLFETLQVRVGLQSLTGANTPTVRSVSVRAFPAADEEFITVLLDTTDEDSSDHVQGFQRTGASLAAAIVSMKRSEEAVSLELAYEHAPESLAERSSYTCRIEEYNQVFKQRGGSSMHVVLRILGD